MNTCDYFSKQSPITDPGDYENLYYDLPESLNDIGEIVKGLFLNYKTWYEFPVGTEMLLQTDALFVSRILENVMTLCNAPLTAKRDVTERVFASASDYASLLCSILRDRNIPCRKRVGYTPGREQLRFGDVEPVFKSYDLVEFWDGSTWTQFDSAGFLEGEFLPASKAWLSWHAGEVPPERFRGDPFRGENVLLSNLLLDLASVNKIELLNWDRYGWMLVPIEELDDHVLSILDDCAEMLLDVDEAFEGLQLLYTREEGARVPQVIECMNPVVKHRSVRLALDS